MTTMDLIASRAALAAEKRKAERTYDLAADHFEAPPLAFWDRTGRRTVDRLVLQPGARVLDVGCGAGASALPAALAVGAAGRVTGIDLSENLLVLARRKASAARLTNVEFRKDDMTAAGFPDGHFDAVVSVFSIFFVPDMKGLVAELWRQVKPGGQLAVTTWGGGFLSPVYERFKVSVLRERPELVSAYNPWDRITAPSSVATLFTDAGIPRSAVSVTAEPARQPLTAPEDWWTIVLGSGLRWTIEMLGPKAAQRVRTDNLDWIAAKGIDSVGVSAIYATARKAR